MEKLFERFEFELKTIEEKLEILNQWLLSKDNIGASDMLETIQLTITETWVGFEDLRRAYIEQEQGHEQIVESNIKYLLGAVIKDKKASANVFEKNKIETTLFRYLDRYVRLTDPECAKSAECNIHDFLLRLVREDMQKHGLLSTPAPIFYAELSKGEQNA